MSPTRGCSECGAVGAGTKRRARYPSPIALQPHLSQPAGARVCPPPVHPGAPFLWRSPKILPPRPQPRSHGQGHGVWSTRQKGVLPINDSHRESHDGEQHRQEPSSNSSCSRGVHWACAGRGANQCGRVGTGTGGSVRPDPTLRRGPAVPVLDQRRTQYRESPTELAARLRLSPPSSPKWYDQVPSFAGSLRAGPGTEPWAGWG